MKNLIIGLLLSMSLFAGCSNSQPQQPVVYQQAPIQQAQPVYVQNYDRRYHGPSRTVIHHTTVINRTVVNRRNYNSRPSYSRSYRSSSRRR